MTVKPVTFYVVECDRCHTKDDAGDYSAWSDASTAAEVADESGWLGVGDKHFCDGCTVWSEDEDRIVPRTDEIGDEK